MPTSVVVYTTGQQTEQGLTIRNVVALTVVDDLLTIEARLKGAGIDYYEHQRFQKGEWTHVEVHAR
jgi:hypothetical protein